LVIPILLAVLVGIPVGIVQASFFEWAFHRYWLHRPWLPKDVFTAHTLVHHQLCKFDDTFEVHEEEQHEALTFQWFGGPLLVAINLIPWALLAGGLALAGIALPYLAFLITFVATVFVYYLGYEGFHYLMHKPSIGWIENSRLFLFLKHHHRIHHFQMDRNLNVLFPLADFCLGTLVLQAETPAVTPPNARVLARRHSDYGKKLRAEGDAPQDQSATVPPTAGREKVAP
jgi:hypothetical protein